MSLTIYIIASFIAATANAGFVWKNDHKDFLNDFQIPEIKIPEYPKINFPKFGSMPPIAFPEPPKPFGGISVTALSTAGIGNDGKGFGRGFASIKKRKGNVVNEVTIGDTMLNTVGNDFGKIPNTKGPCQHYVSSSSSSYSSTTNQNGHTHVEGAADVVQNVNGKVDQKSVRVSEDS